MMVFETNKKKMEKQVNKPKNGGQKKPKSVLLAKFVVIFTLFHTLQNQQVRLTFHSQRAVCQISPPYTNRGVT